MEEAKTAAMISKGVKTDYKNKNITIELNERITINIKLVNWKLIQFNRFGITSRAAEFRRT